MGDARKTAFCSFPGITQISALFAFYKCQTPSPQATLGRIWQHPLNKIHVKCKRVDRQNTMRCTLCVGPFFHGYSSADSSINSNSSANSSTNSTIKRRQNATGHFKNQVSPFTAYTSELDYFKTFCFLILRAFRIR